MRYYLLAIYKLLRFDDAIEYRARNLGIKRLKLVKAAQVGNLYCATNAPSGNY